MQTERLEARASASLLLHPRVGVVVPKYRRDIVDRNRTKRQLRELVRTRIPATPWKRKMFWCAQNLKHMERGLSSFQWK